MLRPWFDLLLMYYHLRLPFILSALHSVPILPIVVTSNPQGRSDLSMLEHLQRQSYPLEPADTAQLIGRETACEVISDVAEFF
jgi:hypothetical protein